MDIAYLLWLQDFRISINDALTPFMEAISFFAINYILFLPAFMYWCISKRKGLFIFFALRIAQTINTTIKLIACVYRPWIRDARIIPAGNAISDATGYSFPSGHSGMSTAICGSMAIFTKKIKWLCCLFILTFLTVMFSRNYLGVHTPQDVIVGFLVGLLGIYIAKCMFSYIERNPDSEDKILAAEFLIATALLVYVNMKSYPMDYVDGKLLVDPNKMTVDSWGQTGGLMVLILARLVEKKFVKFSETGLNFKGVLLSVIGLIPLGFMIWGLKPVIVGFTGAHVGRLLYETCLTFYIIVIWPIVLKIFCGR